MFLNLQSKLPNKLYLLYLQVGVCQQLVKHKDKYLQSVYSSPGRGQQQVKKVLQLCVRYTYQFPFCLEYLRPTIAWITNPYHFITLVQKKPGTRLSPQTVYKYLCQTANTIFVSHSQQQTDFNSVKFLQTIQPLNVQETSWQFFPLIKLWLLWRLNYNRWFYSPEEDFLSVPYF